MSEAGPEAKEISKPARTGWPLDFDRLRKAPPLWLSTTITTVAILLGLALIFLGIIAIGRLGVDLISDNRASASEAIKSILPLAAAAIGLPLIVWRLVILSQQTRTAEDKTQIDRETHYTSIFSRSVDQLGQTKEIKETRKSGDKEETLSKTVPNIEIRLGGIHSLNRLAQESEKDVNKIRNMLLSYVRQNSWTDQNNNLVEIPQRLRLTSYTWRSYLTDGDEGDERDLLEWKADVEKAAAADEKLTGIRDTRVDINEAIDAVRELPAIRNNPEKGTFYESLFVGRSFKADLLARSKFERCTFIRCEFELDNIEELLFVDCRVIECRGRSKKSAINFESCFITNLTIHEASDSLVYCEQCEAVNFVIRRAKDFTFAEFFSTFFKCSLRGEESTSKVRIETSDAGYVECDWSNFTAAEDTWISSAAFSEVTLRVVDLSKAEIDMSNWESLAADKYSLQPQTAERPESWPAYEELKKDPF